MHSANNTVTESIPAALETSIASATEALCSAIGKPTGTGCSNWKPIATIPAEYVLLRHYLGEPVDAVLEAKIANYLRRVQGAPWRLAAGA